MTKSARYLPLASLLLVASLVSSRPIAGQETQPAPNAAPSTTVDSLPFRRGQWGAEFGIDDGTFGLGVLRFRSRRTAWQLNANASADWSKSDPPFDAYSMTSIFVNLRAGPRRYRPLAPAVAAYVGTGLSAGYLWSERTDSWRRGWNAGVFGELGGVYFVTRRLSLGARVEASAGYLEHRQASVTFPAVHRDRHFSIGLSPVRIVGGLYF
jgi:hypothetical protein